MWDTGAESSDVGGPLEELRYVKSNLIQTRHWLTAMLNSSIGMINGRNAGCSVITPQADSDVMPEVSWVIYTLPPPRIMHVKSYLD